MFDKFVAHQLLRIPEGQPGTLATTRDKLPVNDKRLALCRHLRASAAWFPMLSMFVVPLIELPFERTIQTNVRSTV